MAAGGMHDHLGGGFHRYSVDRYCTFRTSKKCSTIRRSSRAPTSTHFKSPKIDNMPTSLAIFLDYVARDMTSKDGGFFSAEDADSVFEHGKPEHGEGEFYFGRETDRRRARRRFLRV